MLLRVLFSLLVFTNTAAFSANGDPELDSLKEFRSRITRPGLIRPEPITNRAGLSPADKKLVTAALPRLDERKIDALAREFWVSPLLRAMLGLRKSFQDGDFESDDEWISESRERLRQTETNAASPSAQGRVLRDPLVLYLSQSGFNRQALSEEMVALTGREVLGGVPVADFFEDDPGRDVPAHFSRTFSPWDFGVRLASASRLDATLLGLMSNPDPFERLTSEDSDDENPDEEENAWDIVMDQLEARIASGNISLSEFSARMKASSILSGDVKRLLTAAAVTSVSARRDCALREGSWREVFWDSGDDLVLFACLGSDQSPKGPVFKIEDGDIEDGNVELSLRDGALEFRGIATSEGLLVETIVNGATIGARHLFWDDGTVRAIGAGGSPSLSGYFAKNGALEWVDRIPSDKNISQAAFYAAGSLRYLVIRNEPDVARVGGFFPSGQPKFSIPYRNGKLDGTAFWWHPSGQLAGEITFSGGKRFGIGRLTYQNGVEGFRAEYGDDQPHGRLIWRDPAGRQLFSIGFVGGKAHGLLELKAGGRIVAEARFDGGAVDGTVLLRNSKGITVATIPFKAGLETGQMVFRDGAGNSRIKSDWSDGKMTGTAESFYSGGTVASRVIFDQGKLRSWLSQRPDGTIRYKGKVASDSDGVATVDFFAVGAEPTLRCQTKDWKLEHCLAGSQKAPMPALKDLIAKIREPGDLAFKPERCGGAVRSIDVTDLIDQSGGTANVTYRVKELCRAPDLATGLDCEVELTGKAWTISECVLTDEVSSGD
jgi:antitoxin component YwqK of YwqJK toxin-antitoxin module